MSANGRRVPDLFHVKRTLFDYSHDHSGRTIKTEVCGTYTDIAPATAAARRRLFDEGYTKESLAKFDENFPTDGHWKYSPEVLVHAETVEGDVIELLLETTPNLLGVEAKPGADGRIGGDLFYVLQTKIYYSQDPTGRSRNTYIKSMHLSYQVAVIAARRLLFEYHDRTWYKQYEEMDKLEEAADASGDVIVRAVGLFGDHYIVSVVHES